MELLKQDMVAMIKVFILATIFAVIISSALAWNCPMHQLICEKAGVQGDCCAADSERTPPAYYHHCTDNKTDCEARLKAEEYKLSRPEIAAHLYADAMCPVHWYSFDSCHSTYETKAESMGSFVLECTDKKGVNHTLEFSPEYIDNVSEYVRVQMGTTAPVIKQDPFTLFIGKIFDILLRLFG